MSEDASGMRGVLLLHGVGEVIMHVAAKKREEFESMLENSGSSTGTREWTDAQ